MNSYAQAATVLKPMIESLRGLAALPDNRVHEEALITCLAEGLPAEAAVDIVNMVIGFRKLVATKKR